jgi:hypothetical protein
VHDQEEETEAQYQLEGDDHAADNDGDQPASPGPGPPDVPEAGPAHRGPPGHWPTGAAGTPATGFVQAAARSAADTASARQDSAMSEEQWWAANAPLLARVFDETKYPTAARVGAAAGAAHGAAYDAGHAYHFGLQRVLDGLGILIDTSGAR